MPTLEEIARLADVSRSTVSRVINDDPNVNSITRKRVLEVIQRSNFQPNRAARSLAGGRTHILGLIIPMSVNRLFTDPYFPFLIQGVTSFCNATDYSVMLWVAQPEYERRTINQILHNGLIDGIIVSSNVLDDPVIEALRESKLPYIQIGRHPTDENVSYIDVDNFNSARDAVALLFKLGRKRVATITGPVNMIAGMDRREGYLAALKEWGINPNPEWIVDGGFTESGGYEATRMLLNHKPDAIFAASDPMAFGAMRALREVNLRVPEDVAIIGFDDIPAAATAEPPLTTIRQPVTRTGMLAAETLIDMLDHPGSSPRRIVLPTELMIRSSCGSLLKTAP